MEPDSGPTRVRSYVRGRLPGGQLPDHGKLLTDTFVEFGDHIGPYLLAGLAQTVIIVPISIVAVFGVYVCAGAGGMGTFLVTAMLAEGFEESVGSDLGGLVPFVAAAVPIVVALVLLFVVIGALAAVMAPVTASMTRAVADHQRGEGQPLGFSAPFATAMQEPGKVITVALAQTAASLLLLPFCIVPVFLVALFTWFAPQMAALHEVSARESIALAMQHVRAHLTWHAIFLALMIGIGIAAANIPVVGPAFLVALSVRAHRELFGDGVEPVLDVVRA